MPTKSQLGDGDITRYWDAYYSAVETAMTAHSKLQQLEDDAEDLGERSGYRSDRLRLEADVELLRARRIAFMANTASIQPPSSTDVQAIQALAAQVAKETATRNRASAIVGAATSAMTAFSRIQAQ
jgi:hypothetical protein